jgi:hypothetical protein
MAALATKNDGVAQASIPVLPDSPRLRSHSSSLPPEASASASTFRYRPAVDPPSPDNIHHSELGPGHHLVDSGEEDVEEVLLVDSLPLLPHPSGSCVHPSSPPFYGPLPEHSSPSCYSSDHQRSNPSSSTANLHDSMDTPPPPPLSQRRPQHDDDLEVPPTPESEPRTSPTFADIVRQKSSPAAAGPQAQINYHRSFSS